MVKKLLEKYKSMLLYVVFGGLTTVVNIISYYICARVIHMNTGASTAIAWFVAVAFAYVTNRTYVFESNAHGVKEIMAEVTSFFTCRVLTGVLEIGIMLLCVDVMGFDDLLMKVVSNVVVIILNYIASKLVIFKESHT